MNFKFQCRAKMKRDTLIKLLILISTVGIIFTAYLFKNRSSYEQSEVAQVLKALGVAEENYYRQFKKYTIHKEELGIDFSKLSNVSIHFTVESLPVDIKLSKDNIPNVSEDFYRIIALFKTSSGQLQIWKLEKRNRIQLLQTI